MPKQASKSTKGLLASKSLWGISQQQKAKATKEGTL